MKEPEAQTRTLLMMNTGREIATDGFIVPNGCIHGQVQAPWITCP